MLSRMLGYAGKSGEKVQGIFSQDVQKSLREKMSRFGSIVYGAFVIVVALGGMWLGLTLSNVNSFAELRTRLHASVGSLSMLFGIPPSPTADAPVSPAALTAHGQITAMDELPISSPYSARIVSVHVKEGSMVEKGALLFKLDDRDAQANIKSAQTELASAKLELEKLNAAPAAATAAPAGNEAQVSIAIESGYTEVTAVFLNLQWITASMETVLYGESVNPNVIQQNIYAYADMIVQRKPDVIGFRDRAAQDYAAMREKYLATLVQYRDSSQNSDAAMKETLMTATLETLKSVNASLKSTSDYLAYVNVSMQSQGVPEILSSHQSSITEASVTANDNLEAMMNAISTLNDAKGALAGGGEDTSAATAAQLELEKREAAIRVENAEHALLEAQRAAGDYSVYAPADGKIAKIDGKAGMSVVNGEIVLTIASPQNVARVSLAEADIIKVRTGQKATVSFDAIQGFSLEGRVFKVDSRATVENNSVLFYVLIAIPEDARAMPGMTVTAKFGD